MARTAKPEGFEIIESGLIRLSQIAKDPKDRRLAAVGRYVLLNLMPQSSGRPVTSEGLGFWRFSPTVQKRVVAILHDRDLEDPESITETSKRLTALATRWIGRLTALQTRRLRRFASTNTKPTEVILTLHAWRHHLPLRAVKRLMRDSRAVLIRWE